MTLRRDTKIVLRLSPELVKRIYCHAAESGVAREVAIELLVSEALDAAELWQPKREEEER